MPLDPVEVIDTPLEVGLNLNSLPLVDRSPIYAEREESRLSVVPDLDPIVCESSSGDTCFYGEAINTDGVSVVSIEYCSLGIGG